MELNKIVVETSESLRLELMADLNPGSSCVNLTGLWFIRRPRRRALLLGLSYRGSSMFGYQSGVRGNLILEVP